MKKDSDNTLVYLGVGVLLLGAGYLMTRNSNHVKTKQNAIDTIVFNLATPDKKASMPGTLAQFDEPYLIAWANAIIDNKSHFNLDGKTYVTLTGRATTTAV